MYAKYFIIFVALILSDLACTKASALEPGESAPLFSLPDRSGTVLNLNQYKGKVVYIDFWASWCGPCKRSLPWLANLKQQFNPTQFEVLAVNLDSSREEAERLLSEDTSKLTVLFDPAGGVPEQYGLRTMPSSYLVDREGKVSAVFEGFDEEHKSQIEEKIRSQFD